MKISIAIMKAGHQKSPMTHSPTPIAIKQPLDSFGLIGCPQCGHFSADFETSLLQAGQVIKSAIDCLSVYIFSVHRFVARALGEPNLLANFGCAVARAVCPMCLAVRNETVLCRAALPPTTRAYDGLGV
jgi:hypothetical protein